MEKKDNNLTSRTLSSPKSLGKKASLPVGRLRKAPIGRLVIPKVDLSKLAVLHEGQDWK